MKISSAIHFYGTRDLSVTYDFYVNKLGFSLTKDQGVCHIYQLTESSLIGFCEHIPIVCQDRSPIITLVVDDVWAVYHEFKSWCDISEPVISAKFSIEHFFMKDPNGYTMEIQRFL
jgi:catechol 2,3-dioxygenase-like lactoylglutathione lyase family enzyme